MTTEEEAGGMQLPAQEINHQTWKRPGRIPSRVSEGALPADTLILDLWPPELRENYFLWFKPWVCGSL